MCKCMCVAEDKKVLLERGFWGILELQKRSRILNLLLLSVLGEGVCL